METTKLINIDKNHRNGANINSYLGYLRLVPYVDMVFTIRI